MLSTALRRPITIMVAMVAIALGSVYAVFKMRSDVFPNLNMPVIYVAQAYGGMDSQQMEGLISSYYEMVFLYMNGIDHVESKNIQNLALIKLYFHPGTDMSQAMAEAAIYANRAKAYFPPGTIPPFIMRLDASCVPVAFLVLSSDTHDINELSDLMLFSVRPRLGKIDGAAAPQPFGGSLRTIMIYADPERLKAYDMSPQDLANAVNTGNLVTPSGNARIRDTNPVVSINSMVLDKDIILNIPIRLGEHRPVYVRDVAEVKDESDTATGYALVNGKKAVYLPIIKTADASTLSVVNGLKDGLQGMRDVLPKDTKLTLEFDQAPYVTNAIAGVVQESAMGAMLTGLMVLLFLRDWRSVIVVLLTIPLALMGALMGLWAVGQTVNLMTLGGLSLAVGILVDEATVVIENIHTQMGKQGSIARAVFIGTAETAAPNFLAMLCILAVFLPSFMMEGAARGLFIPLAISVGFAMIFAFVLSMTFVPVLAIWLLKHSHAEPHGKVKPGHFPATWFFSRFFRNAVAGAVVDAFLHQPIRWVLRHVPQGHHGAWDRFSFARIQGRYATTLEWLLGYRYWLIPGYLCVSIAFVSLALYTLVGREIAPTVDAGQFQLRVRAPSGTRLRVSEELTRQALDVIKDVCGADNVGITVSYVGVTAPTYTVNAIFQWTSGTDQAIVRVALKKETGLHVAEIKEKLRKELPKKLIPWAEKQLQADGYSPDDALARARTMSFSFEPADVVNQVMSFGSPTPVELVIAGKNLNDDLAYATKIHDEMAKIPSLRDLQYGQNMAYPRVMIDIDRERAGFAYATEADAANAMLSATNSSRYIMPIFWADINTGIGYQVQVQVPQGRLNTLTSIGEIPIKPIAPGAVLRAGGQELIRDIGKVSSTTMPEEYDRLNQSRYISLTANVVGEDLGGATSKIQKALKAAGDPPRGVSVEMRGQVTPMLQMFSGLATGLCFAVVVVFLMLAAFFQSIKLAIVAVATTPAVLAGVMMALWLTGTTLNIESFMGSIMAVGVAVANAILLVTFAERQRQTNSDAAQSAVFGGRERLRPILMTSCAMIAGMIPMSLGLGEGGEQTAALGRAVVGGLLVATFATLFILPSVFTALLGTDKAGSSSIHPDDAESSYFDPPANSSSHGHHGGHDHHGGHENPGGPVENPI